MTGGSFVVAKTKKELIDLKKSEWDTTVSRNPRYKRDFFIKTIVCFIVFILMTIFLINSTTPPYLEGVIAYGCLAAIWRGWKIK